ncbi:site-specific integrase [Clostridium perfringens]|nr:site-specific integrase [Clostridium perfringens]MDK0664806.1 site-specific integrase [Clostridium perfringens]
MEYNVTYRQKDKGWQFIISYKDYNGKWRQKSKQGFKTKKEAKPIAEKMLQDLKKNIKTINNSLGKITFKAFSDMYLEHEKLYKEPKTIESLITVIRRFQDLNDKELCKITNLDIQKIVDNMTKEHLNNNTIRYYLKILNSIFLCAKFKYNILDEVPSKYIKIGKSIPTKKKALNDDEINDLLLQFKNTKYYLVVYLAVNTGMRIGEILGLTWNDIDFNNCLININKQWKKLKDNSWGLGNVKSKNSTRIIPISNSVAEELLKHKTIINIDNRVFNFKSKNTVLSRVNRLLKENGFDISLHELRHTYATKLIANGVDFKTAAKILGHSVEQTMKVYSHVNNDMLNKAHSIIENIF